MADQADLEKLISEVLWQTSQAQVDKLMSAVAWKANSIGILDKLTVEVLWCECPPPPIPDPVRRSIVPSRITLKLQPSDPAPAPYSDGIGAPINWSLVLADGNLDNQMNVLLNNELSIGAGLTHNYDLKLDTDRYGIALALADVALLYVEHEADSAASSVHLEPNTTNGWVQFLAAGSDLILYPGDFIVLGSFTAANQLVTPTDKAFDVVNDDGSNAADVKVQWWGRR